MSTQSWYLRSAGDLVDAHLAEITPDGTVESLCGARFDPAAVFTSPSTPPDPRVCPDCQAAYWMSWGWGMSVHDGRWHLVDELGDGDYLYPPGAFKAQCDYLVLPPIPASAPQQVVSGVSPTQCLTCARMQLDVPRPPEFRCDTSDPPEDLAVFPLNAGWPPAELLPPLHSRRPTGSPINPQHGEGADHG